MEEVLPRFHAERLRKGRVSLPGQIYLVTAVTHDRVPLFSDFYLGRIVVNALCHEQEKGTVESLAFVLMPDHLHWLFALGEGASLSDVLKSVKGFSAHRISANRGISERAEVWQKGFHDHALRRDEDLKAVARYLVLNPVRAGLVTNLWEYPLWDAIWVGET
jgi:putative transposase